MRAMQRDVAKVIVIFPFEEAFYAAHHIPVTYVGHPIVEQLEGFHAPEALPAAEEPLRIALMPGSRRMEVEALMPAMLDAVETLGRHRRVDAYVIQAPTIDREMIETHLRGRDGVRVVSHEGGRQLSLAHLAISSSGTATLEAAVIGVPVVVLYKLSPATYQLARLLVRLPSFSLVNIVAGKEVVPELIQGEVRGDRVAAAAETLLRPETYPLVKRELARVRSLLGESGSSAKAAERVWSILNA
jgi:lipid-A-disaccharide synthase